MYSMYRKSRGSVAERTASGDDHESTAEAIEIIKECLDPDQGLVSSVFVVLGASVGFPQICSLIILIVLIFVKLNKSA
jgi:hypothetical protein